MVCLLPEFTGFSLNPFFCHPNMPIPLDATQYQSMMEHSWTTVLYMKFSAFSSPSRTWGKTYPPILYNSPSLGTRLKTSLGPNRKIKV